MIFIISVVSKMIILTVTPIYEKQIDSIEEIVEKSFDLAGDSFAKQHLMKQTEVVH